MIVRHFAILLIFMTVALPVFAQDKPTENSPEPEAHGTRLQWKDLPKNIWRDEKAIASSPLHINRSNSKWWIIVGTGAAALIATDRTVSNHLPNSNAQLTISRWASRLGADYTIYPVRGELRICGRFGRFRRPLSRRDCSGASLFQF